MIHCPLCGFEFESTAMSCHSSCAFNESCGIICCPNCGYQMPDEQKSRVAEALRRWLSRRREQQELLPVRPLSAMRPGESGKVVAINSQSHNRVERLHVLGLINDAHVTLEQKRPTYVLRVGFTELSIEQDIAQEIMVDVGS
ncbi:MAG: FeoA domain-containing protein [Anaerolineae bacterium]